MSKKCNIVTIEQFIYNKTGKYFIENDSKLEGVPTQSNRMLITSIFKFYQR